MSIVLPSGGKNGHDLGNGVSLHCRMPAIVVYLTDVTARAKKSFVRMAEHAEMIVTEVDAARGAFQVVGHFEQLERLSESKCIREFHLVVNDRIPFVGKSSGGHPMPIPRDVSASAIREAKLQRASKAERIATLDIADIKGMGVKLRKRYEQKQLAQLNDELERNGITTSK